MTNDFLERLLIDTLNGRGYFAPVVSAVLRNGNSIAVMVTPSNNYRHYYDGSFEQSFTFQIMTKHEDELLAYQTLLAISSFLTTIPDIPSENDSYEFNQLNITTSPNVIGQDEKYFIYGAQFSAELYFKGVETDG
ncbi:minor capsid protein [Alkalihalophilus marmarensis]|uniref:phage tail terminator protein n=1 Tax=Alkalihalophilus marmarensis TaxID=521377 RepID=UPI002E1EBAA2|nr:minor capsid protein [Alkalihalophilus marmarensis]